MIAELAEIDSLPGSQIQAAIGDGNRQADSEQRAFGMSRHVIKAFHRVSVVWLSLLDHVIQDRIHIRPDIRIKILVDVQSA